MSDMSDNDTCVASVAFHIEDLIEEVKKRPALWDKTFFNRPDKMKKWTEVCEALFTNWDRFSATEKRMAGTTLRRKWKNVKDNFTKEQLRLKRILLGLPAKQKKTYMYYDSLSFLARNRPERETISFPQEELSPSDAENEEQQTEYNIEVPSPKRSKSETDVDNKVDNLQDLVKLLRSQPHKEYDEDVSFAEMMVPMLRKLNEEQKHYAKMEIMTALNNALYDT